MSRKLTISLFAVVCGLALVSAAIVSMAQTGDGDPPSAEAVCDHLIGGTPGLYGLCIAFAEAQDCDSDTPFVDCKPASAKIIEIYNNKKQPGDPDMPGVAGDCPCFDAGDLSNIPEPHDCSVNGDAQILHIDPISDDFYLDNVSNGGICQHAAPDDPLSWIQYLNEAQIDACRSLIENICPSST